MRTRRITETLPDELMVGLHALGRDIAAARRARRMSQDDLAGRLNVGRKTVIRMEKGDERVKFGAYASAAWVMGLETNLVSAFSTDRDPVQLREARLSLPRRIDAPRERQGGHESGEAPEAVSADDKGLDF